jgi:hypothetical protein
VQIPILDGLSGLLRQNVTERHPTLTMPPALFDGFAAGGW